MTNAEKYLKDGVDIEEMLKEYYKYLETYPEETRSVFCNWLQESVKPTLTEDEKVILRNVPQRYHTIGRCGNGTLCLKCNDMGDYGTETDCEIDVLYGLLFQFIKPRRRI